MSFLLTIPSIQASFEVLLISPGIIASSGPTWKENRTTAFQILKSFGVGKDVMSQKINKEVRFKSSIEELLNITDTTKGSCITRGLSVSQLNCWLDKSWIFLDQILCGPLNAETLTL